MVGGEYGAGVVVFGYARSELVSGSGGYGLARRLDIDIGMNDMNRNEELKVERMMKELQSDLADMVDAGELTEQEANEWANHKADQWANGLN